MIRHIFLLLGKAGLTLSLSAPTQLRKGGPWAWSTSSPRDKGPTQPLHSLCQVHHLVWEYLSLFQGQRVLFCLCLKYVQNTAPVQPHCYICPLRKWDRVPSTAVWEGCAVANFPASPTGRETSWWWGTDTHSWSWSYSLSSLCEFSIVASSAWQHCVFLGNSDTKMQWAEVFRVLPWDR